MTIRMKRAIEAEPGLVDAYLNRGCRIPKRRIKGAEADAGEHASAGVERDGRERLSLDNHMNHPDTGDH